MYLCLLVLVCGVLVFLPHLIFPPSLAVLVDKLLKWPAGSVFPALDLVRLLVLHPRAASHYTRHTEMLKQLMTVARGGDEIVRYIWFR